LGWLLVGPILQELAKAALDDYVKDFFKGCIKDVEGLAKKPFAQNAVRDAIKYFTQCFEQELQRSGLDKKQIQQYLQPLRQFLKQPPVRQVLGSALQANCRVLDTAILALSWQTLTLQHPVRRNLPTLTRIVPSHLLKEQPTASFPDAFNWERVAEKYLASVKLIIEQNAELREILNAQNLDGILGRLTDSGPIPADFNLESYQEGLREQYEYLDLGNLDTRSGEYERQLTVKEIFIPHAQSENNSDVVISRVQEIAQGWKDDPATLPNLKQRAQSDEDWTVRLSALQELVRAWKDDPETLPWLKQLAQSDDDGAVRRAAVQELAQGWKDDPETLPILTQLAQSDDDRAVRRAAVQELARGWKDDPETLPILKQLAQSDNNWAVRRAAAEELARGWKDDPETLPILKQLAQSDDDSDLRQAAVEELARGWKDDPETLPWLKQRAQSDDEWLVRQAAVQQLAWGWKDDPETLPWLKQRAQSDDAPDVRYAAVQELARGWKDDPELFELLCNVAINDPFDREDEWQSNPRQGALAAMIELYPDPPQTLELVRDRAQNDRDQKLREFAQEKLTQLEGK
jgi:HEAT repeat protein